MGTCVTWIGEWAGIVPCTELINDNVYTPVNAQRTRLKGNIQRISVKKQPSIYGFIIERVQHASSNNIFHTRRKHTTNQVSISARCTNNGFGLQAVSCLLMLYSGRLKVAKKREPEDIKNAEHFVDNGDNDCSDLVLRFVVFCKFFKQFSKQNQLNSRFPVRFHLRKFSFILHAHDGTRVHRPTNLCSGTCALALVCGVRKSCKSVRFILYSYYYSTSFQREHKTQRACAAIIQTIDLSSAHLHPPTLLYFRITHICVCACVCIYV